MNKQTKIVSSKGKAELSSSEQGLLKGAFDSLRVSSERVERLFFAVLSWQDLIKGFKGCSKFTLTIIADSLCNFRYSHIGFS